MASDENQFTQCFRGGKSKGICCCLCTTIILMVIILLLISLTSLNYDEFGIAYNRLSKSIDDEVYEEGRHFLSIPSLFIIYKRTVQSISWGKDSRITCYSSEGLELTMEIKVQFQITKDKLLNIFHRFGKEEQYINFLHNFIKYNIINQCGNFYAQQYYFNRSVIEKNLESNMKTLANINDLGSEIILLQLIAVSHPGEYNSINEDKQKLLQDRLKFIRQREEQINKEITEYLKIEKTIEILMIDSYGQANSTVIVAQKMAEAETNKWRTRQIVFGKYRDQPGELISFLKYFMIRSKDNLIQKFD